MKKKNTYFLVNSYVRLRELNVHLDYMVDWYTLKIKKGKVWIVACIVHSQLLKKLATSDGWSVIRALRYFIHVIQILELFGQKHAVCVQLTLIFFVRVLRPYLHQFKKQQILNAPVKIVIWTYQIQKSGVQKTSSCFS